MVSFSEINPEPGDLAEPFINIDQARPLIVGIMPHTQCISLDRARYRSRFSSDVTEHFPAAFSATLAGGLSTQRVLEEPISFRSDLYHGMG